MEYSHGTEYIGRISAHYAEAQRMTDECLGVTMILTIRKPYALVVPGLQLHNAINLFVFCP
jgi:hypothetical protein